MNSAHTVVDDVLFSKSMRRAVVATFEKYRYKLQAYFSVSISTSAYPWISVVQKNGGLGQKPHDRIHFDAAAAEYGARKRPIGGAERKENAK